MEDNHILRNHTILCLATKYNHRSLVDDCRVILTRTNRHTFGLAHFNATRFKVVLEDLVRAFTYLPLTIKLKATTKDIQLIVVWDSRVALTALDLLL